MLTCKVEDGAEDTSTIASCTLHCVLHSALASETLRGIYLTGVIEYVCAEILELAGNSAKAWEICRSLARPNCFRTCRQESKKQRIIPRNIQLAIRNDEASYQSEANVGSMFYYVLLGTRTYYY